MAKAQRDTAPDEGKAEPKARAVILSGPLAKLLVDLASDEKTSVAKLVDESPLMTWLKARRLLVLKKKLDETAELKRQIAEAEAELKKK